MLRVLENLANVLRIDRTRNDNEVFRMHYKLTLAILIGASMLVTAREYFGDPIDCVPIGEGDLLQKMVDTFCWIHSTFTLPQTVGKAGPNDVAYPGVEKYHGYNGQTRVYQKYYQWVCFALFFQGILFYIPRYLWKAFEGGRMKKLTQSLESPMMSPEDKKEQLSMLTSYFVSTLKLNDMYFYKFAFCEFLNLFNVIFQIFIMDWFLGGEFSSFGLDVLKHTQADQEFRTDPMIRVFPRMAKCTYKSYGSSGDMQKHDTLCVLPLNILNEKIYVFLWFWFMFLTFVSLLALGYRLATMFSMKLRVYVTSARVRMADKNVLRCVIHSISVSDWFLLHLISKNLDPLNYKELLIEIARMIKSDRNGNGKALLAKRDKIDKLETSIAMGDTSIGGFGDAIGSS
jgi:hypothetical protein